MAELVADQSKRELRLRMATVRDAVANRDLKSSRICDAVKRHEQFSQSNSIMLFIQIRSEVNLNPLIDQLLLAAERRVLIPYVAGDSLHAFQLASRDQLEQKSFGLLEPNETALAETGPFDRPIDLIIVPGLAFDRNLNRLGYGKGHYDRFLSQKQPDAFRMAVAFDEQIVSSVPTGEFDQPMQAIVTPTHRIQ